MQQGRQAPRSLVDLVLGEAGQLLELNPGILEKRFKEREIYQSLVVEPPLAIRLDGVGWGRRLRGKYRWPRDPSVHRALVDAAAELLGFLNACCALVISDEVSVVLVSEPPYGGRVEKLVSTSAGLVSATVSRLLGETLYTDARIAKLYSVGDAETYILYRMRVGFNNYVSSLYHMLPGSARGQTPGLREMLKVLAERIVSDEAWEPWRLMGTCVARMPAVKRIDGRRARRKRIVALDASPGLCKRMIREQFSAQST
ncbi:hypothetical protein PYJP_16830 [Pyrofollis japonicus]|uniref:tRNA(His) guanylyltransferase Thg1 family protein n=1 Tax=Pyrofollis japonicus TaxID=3060460 RepID=UPI00295BC633|nr:tRNA(His) guanylyltransferase Thg1 family protein [Pyrofollis japonicus]BEP18331.1 hypothetical protein PYJP_16830 [Pyrofollis japonicus]